MKCAYTCEGCTDKCGQGVTHGGLHLCMQCRSYGNAQSAILPCPFCGGDAKVYGKAMYKSWSSDVRCDACQSTGPVRSGWSRADADADAVKAWNSRP